MERQSGELLSRVGARARARRLSLGLSVKACASSSGLSARYLIQLEAGQANASLSKLSALASTLGVRVAELLSEGERGRIDSLLSQLSPAELEEAYELLSERFGAPTAPMISLLGVRGAGKSSVGRRLAEELGWRFIELDAEVERLADLSIAELFSLHDESYYRRLEREALLEVLGGARSSVIATGGSIVTCEESFALLHKYTHTVWLSAQAERHWERVILQGDQRPMRDHPHAMAELRALLATRAPLYQRARYCIDTSRLSVEEVLSELLDRVAHVTRSGRVAP